MTATITEIDHPPSDVFDVTLLGESAPDLVGGAWFQFAIPHAVAYVNMIPGAPIALVHWIESQRRGAGHLIVAAVIDWARSQSIGLLLLAADDLVSWYEQQGFRRQTIVGSPGGGVEMAWWPW